MSQHSVIFKNNDDQQSILAHEKQVNTMYMVWDKWQCKQIRNEKCILKTRPNILFRFERRYKICFVSHVLRNARIVSCILL